MTTDLMPRWQFSTARAALFIVYFWFGILKVFGASPATPLVETLHAQTVSFIPFELFLVLFGLFETVLGVLFLFPRITRIALCGLALHLITTMLPLVALPHMVWTGWLTPTLEGQYIIKNVLIIALAFVIRAGYAREEVGPQGAAMPKAK